MMSAISLLFVLRGQHQSDRCCCRFDRVAPILQLLRFAGGEIAFVPERQMAACNIPERSFKRRFTAATGSRHTSLTAGHYRRMFRPITNAGAVRLER